MMTLLFLILFNTTIFIKIKELNFKFLLMCKADSETNFHLIETKIYSINYYFTMDYLI